MLSSGSTMSLWVSSLGNSFFLARKLLKEVRFPEIGGKVCRALPYEKTSDSLKQIIDSKSSLFVKGLSKTWTHKDLFDHFKAFGEIASVKVSINESHLSRGYGFVLFTREEFAQKAIENVREYIFKWI
jgi:RNA recognition motif. (a.k.a. RRM, RBD, or RNP domain)